LNGHGLSPAIRRCRITRLGCLPKKKDTRSGANG
jgi:hypothetical protein